MHDLFRFIVEFFRSPKYLFAAAMIANAMILEWLAFRMINAKSISSPLIQFFLYCIGAVFAIIAAFVLLRKSPALPPVKSNQPTGPTQI